MITLTGKRVSEGIAIGKISFYKRDQKDIRKISVKDVEKEVSRYIKAKERAISELDELYLMATRDVGDANAMIFETQKKLIEDPDISDEIQKRILNEEINAEFIIQEIIDSYISDTKKRGKDSLATHEADVRDAFTRLIRILQHTFKERIIYDEPFVMAADEIYPSEILQFDKSKILGFITTAGTLNSHTSVLARTKGIPSIIGVGESLKEEYDGKSVIIDGFTGKIYIEPDYTTLTKFRKKRDSNLNYRKNLEKLKGKENVTQSGQRIAVLANVANREDIESVLRSDAGGIGLYRTEFLFMENDTLPTEDQQYLEYKLAAEAMGSKPVSIRTVDMGSDKTIREIDEGKVRNPALGYRGIRLLLNDEDVFYTQIRAILRASIYGNLSILLPMVTSSEEVSRAKEIIEKVKDDLRSSKILFDEDINLGVMIETPAAVMISGELARQVDYFSIGTNDLTALTLGVDRMNPKVEELFDVEHPAIMKMIRIITNNAHLEEKPVAICGDAAADLGLTEYFIKVGIDGLSVEPQKVLSLRKKVREIR